MPVPGSESNTGGARPSRDTDRTACSPTRGDGGTTHDSDGEWNRGDGGWNRSRLLTDGGQDDQNRPPPPRNQGDAKPVEQRYSGWVLFGRDVLVSLVAVFLVGAYLFTISGVWPPMVAIESGSMEPNMDINDLVFIMETDRFQPEMAHEETGVVTAATAQQSGYTKFGDYGDVIVFTPNGDGDRTPIIHRAHFWVEAGENWYDRANPAYINDADSCEAIGRACPAPHDGFITKGDNNPTYDQVGEGLSEPVKEEWVVGTAEKRIPVVGYFRLRV